MPTVRPRSLLAHAYNPLDAADTWFFHFSSFNPTAISQTMNNNSPRPHGTSTYLKNCAPKAGTRKWTTLFATYAAPAIANHAPMTRGRKEERQIRYPRAMQLRPKKKRAML